ncbi:MAG: FAD-dependent oxidoreductase [Candidatus Acidiferrales bacterium]|jgi:glycerol-3-phosphate dehydrogenase
MKTREEALRAIEGKTFDVCVIGGGATGSGCALDSQLRGLKTVQLEAEDFASGASSASTKMVHGGVRYLQEAIRNLDFKEYSVLKEALHERIHMLQNAPFLTNTRFFLTPCYRWLDVGYFATGLKLYDWIAGRDGLARSTFLSREQALSRMPSLAASGLVGAVVYADGQFNDARYNITLVQTFAEAGGETLNYARLVAFEKNADGKLASAVVADKLTGREFVVHARSFVNAAGPHADNVRRMATPDAPSRIKFSKGVHLILPLETLGSTEAMLIPKTEDGRVLFAIPWLGSLLVGTTDDEIDTPDNLHVEAEEVQYLVRHLNRYLAEPVSAAQIESAMVGVRPLVSSGESRSTKEIARTHEVELDPKSGLISIMGGKWTTYRAMAQDTVDAVQKYLGISISQCQTLRHPLSGSEGYSADYWKELAKLDGVTELSARHLAGQFGTRASEVMDLAREQPELAAPLAEGLAPTRAEAAFVIRDEMAMSIEDVLSRRIGLQTHSWKHAVRAAPAVAELLARELGWSEKGKQEALDQYVAKIRELMAEAGLAGEP